MNHLVSPVLPHRSYSRRRLRQTLFFILLFIFKTQGISQTGWEPIAGGPFIDHSPLSVAVIDSLYTVVGGWGGKIFRTTDGGETWMTSPSGSSDNFEGISFSDRNRGTVVGGTQSTILRTEDGGLTWQKQTNGPFTPEEVFNSVSFSDSVNGVIVTLTGRIYRTSNGGIEWVYATSPLVRGLRRVRLKSSYGLAVGETGDTYRTINRGQSWFFHSALTGGMDLRDVWLIDSLSAVAVGDGGVIRRTTDGGIFWTIITSGVTDTLQSITFTDPLNGVIGTGDGALLRTTDGGLSWSGPQATPMFSVWDIGFGTSNIGFAVTRFDGNIFRTLDGGTSWEPMEYSWRGSYYGVHALNADSLFGVGEGGRIAFSANFGRSWQAQDGNTSVALRGVSFSDPLNGWIVGDSGVILHTTNGGNNWEPQSGNTIENLDAISSPDAEVGFIAGENNTIIGTTDGGSTWTAQLSPVFDHWRALSFLNANVGVAAGRNGNIIKTTDGGENWNILHTVAALSDIDYIDPDHIVAVGKPTGSPQYGITRTNDGGLTWTLHPTNSWEITGAAFSNPGFGAISTLNGLISTQDTGQTWIYHNPSASPFHDITMAGPRAAFAVGDSGVVARMRNNGSIQGVWFHDLNYDSVRNFTDTAMAGQTVYLKGPFADSSLTDTDGRYLFSSLPQGIYSIHPKTMQFWEQSTPPLFNQDVVIISSGFENQIYPNIGFAGPLVRLRLPILVKDNSNRVERVVWCGIRPGATAGIWRAYPGASQIDSIEGEAELPPRSFSRFAGIFDTRFSDARSSIDAATPLFGEGSWTDMRQYSSPSQKDTFQLSFLPGIVFGGYYPMTLQWSAEMVARSFNGPVELIDLFGTVVDMKSTGSLSIFDTSIESIFLVMDSPNIPVAWISAWQLLSIPAPVGDGSVRSLYPSAVSGGYSYTPGVGYKASETLRPNVGYWLKYPPAFEPPAFDSSARRIDSTAVTAGWNLIGTLSVPVAVGSVTTIPSDVTLGPFFGFENGYVPVDTLFPGAAYWIQSDKEGTIILNADAVTTVDGPGARSKFKNTLGTLPSLVVVDADSNAMTLYLSDLEGVDASAYQLPPSPPTGVYDVRYRSQRLVETVTENTPAEYPADISFARFPLKITLTSETSIPVSIRVGDTVIPLREGEPVTIPDAGSFGHTEGNQRVVMTLMTSGHAGTPTEYALAQNYPNPFNPTTVISCSIPTRSSVKIRVYDVVGREVALLLDETAEAGYRSIAWDARDVASGIYFYRMEAVSVHDPARSFSNVRKLVVLR